MKSKMTVIIVLIVIPLSCFGKERVILCDPPQGSRVDYFSFNNLNLQNNTFLMSKDRVSRMQPRIIYNDETHAISFTISDSAELQSLPKSGNMQLLKADENQISFAGSVRDAPILATYYPKNNVLIYSQQSVWVGPAYQGARAVMFYSKCSEQAQG